MVGGLNAPRSVVAVVWWLEPPGQDTNDHDHPERVECLDVVRVTKP